MMHTEAASSTSMQIAYFMLKVYKNNLVRELNNLLLHEYIHATQEIF